MNCHLIVTGSDASSEPKGKRHGRLKYASLGYHCGTSVVLYDSGAIWGSNF